MVLRSHALVPAWPGCVLFVVAGLLVGGGPPAPPAAAQEVGQAASDVAADLTEVRLQSGEVISGLTDCKVDKRYRILVLTGPQGERRVSFTEVVAVIVGGEDRTVEILGGRYAPAPASSATAPPDSVAGSEVTPAPAPSATTPPDSAAGGEATPAPAPAARASAETWLPAGSEAIRQARTPIWSRAVRVAGNYGAPTGDYYDGTKGGPGWEGDVLFAISNQLALRFSVSRSGMDWDDDIVFVSYDADYEVVGQELSMRVMRYYGALQAYWHLDKERRERSMFYACFGLGAIHHEMGVDLTLREISTGDLRSESAGESTTKFLATYGAGLTKSLSRDTALDLAVSVDQVWVGDASSEAGVYSPGATAWILDAKAGLVVFF